MKTSCLALIAAIGCLGAPSAIAGQYVYPARGQDQATQAKDEAECSTWATQQTGVAAGQATATTGVPTDASAVTSMLGGMSGSPMAGGALAGGGAAGAAGALMGSGAGGGMTSALGAIPGAPGALGGGALGGVGSAGGVSQVMQMASHAVGKPASQAPGQADYDKARAACLSGRGYSVQ